MRRKRRKRTLDDGHLALDGDLRYPPGSFLHNTEGTGELILQLRGLLGLRRGRREAEGKDGQSLIVHNDRSLPLTRERQRKKLMRRDGERTFSSNTKQLNNAAVCCGVKSLNTPPNTISVNNNSSPLEISHATRPFCSTTSSFVAKPRRLNARLRLRSSSRWITEWAAWIFFFVERMEALRDSLEAYWS
jgi:hypothetical protein